MPKMRLARNKIVLKNYLIFAQKNSFRITLTLQNEAKIKLSFKNLETIVRTSFHPTNHECLA